MRSDDGGYRPIGDYAAIGDCHGSALVASNGRIDWCCLERFDADPVFCRLLDDKKGGFISLQPRAKFKATRAYVKDTNILRTEFHTTSGSFAVEDFMPVGRTPEASAHDYVTLNAPKWLIRRIEVLEGQVDLECVYRPSTMFASRPAQLSRAGNAIVLGIGGPSLQSDILFAVSGERAEATSSLRAGDVRFIALSAEPAAITAERVDQLRAITTAFWREWISYCRYQGPYAEAVKRSALISKLMTYAPTGATVAALTTSLPEQLGGERNWDYRFCWIRDASLMLYALATLGYAGEARQFYKFLGTVSSHSFPDLQVLYGIGHERDIEERRRGDFVWRYLTEDGLQGEESPFLICSFWLVDALLFAKRPVEAKALFEALLKRANDVRLYAEEMDEKSGDFIGNFPQAFTHIGLIGSAVNLALFEKGGIHALRGANADRAKRYVRATIGWRGVIAGLLHHRFMFRLYSSRKSRMPANP